MWEYHGNVGIGSGFPVGTDLGRGEPVINRGPAAVRSPADRMFGA